MKPARLLGIFTALSIIVGAAFIWSRRQYFSYLIPGGQVGVAPGTATFGGTGGSGGNMYGNIFYDHDNTAYLLDPASTGYSLLVAGKVGIGTTNPGQKPSVAGTIESTTGGFKFPDGTTQASAGARVLGSRQAFTSSGTWTRPAGVAKVLVAVVGGGSGGGSSTVGLGGGGGGGGYSSKVIDVTGVPSVTVTVGADGGAGVAGS